MGLNRALAFLLTTVLVMLAAAPAHAALPLGSPDLPETRAVERPADGVEVTRITRGAARAKDGPWRVASVRVSRALLDGRVGVRFSNDTVLGLQGVTGIARRVGAVAAVNGPFFLVAGQREPGDVVGAAAVDGELVSEPVDGRSVLLLGSARRPGASVTPLRFRGSVRLGDRTRLLDGVNRAAGSIWGCGGRGGDLPTSRPSHGTRCTDLSELIRFTPRWGLRTPVTPGGIDVVVRDGRVTSVRPAGGTAIPRDGLVLAGTGDAAGLLRSAAGRSTSSVERLLGPDGPIDLADHPAMVSGGPRLLTAGRTTVAARAEGFRPPTGDLYQRFVLARNPRTLAGTTAEGDLLLVVIDGRRPGYSVGATLAESAGVMRDLGATDALNLDGGGSTTLALNGSLANRPSDPGGERPTGAAVVVLPAAGR